MSEMSAFKASPADFRQLASAAHGRVIVAGDPDYDEARSLFNGMIDRRPAAIVRVADADDVRRCLELARKRDLPVAVRGGGHNVAGNALCDGGLVIDWSDRRAVRVGPEERLACAEPGATWAEFDAATQAHGLATTGGLVSTTGIAGFTLGGGFGWLVRKHGLAADNLIAAEVVNADGELVRATTTEHEDLLWALRGGGGNFGVVSAFEYRLHPLGEVLGGLVAHPLARASEVLRFFREFTSAAPDELTTMAALLTGPEGQPLIGLGACYAGDPTRGEEILQPLRAFGPPLMDHFAVMAYPALQQMFDESAPSGALNYWRSGFLDELSDAAIEAVVAHAAEMPRPMAQVHLHHLGGAMARTPVEATAFAHRVSPYIYNIIGMWREPQETQSGVAWVRDFGQAMQPLSAGAYLNFMGEEGEKRVRSALGVNYERLAAVKARYDPANLFHVNQNIKPARPEAA